MTDFAMTVSLLRYPLHRKSVLLVLHYSLRSGGYFHASKHTRMRLSVVFELLLVFLFLAFAAARVIDPAKGNRNVAKGSKKTTVLRQGPPNRYCACTSRMCNCCRDFSLPVVPLKGPGCASIMYVQRDTMMVTMSFGDRVLSNTTISGKTPKPICMALPGGISQFCGRIYGISRKGDQFRACLGLELRALDDIEAALRVSCFKFGPKGVKLESAPPVPVESGGKDPDEDEEEDYDLEDDDDDDLIGFGVDDEDDGSSNEDNEVDSDSVDYTGFSVLGEDLLGTLFSDDSGSSTKKKKPSKKTAKPQVVVPKISSTTRRPLLPNRRRSTAKPLSLVTKRPLLNRITKTPSLSASRPSIVQKPFIPIISTTETIQFVPVSSVSSTVVTKNDLNKNVVTKISTVTTEAPPTTTPVMTSSSESSKIEASEEEQNQAITLIQTEEPITFTIPTQKVEAVKNDIKLPQGDLAKVEAVAAIAQQLVPSGVISSSSITSEETNKPLDVVTVNYEKIAPTDMAETTLSYSPSFVEKISSVKFIPTTVVTSKPEENFKDETMDTDTVTSSESESAEIKNKINTLQENNEDKKGDKESEKVQTVSINNSSNKKEDLTTNVKKQPIKKPEKEEDEEEDEEEEEEEEEGDLLEGVLSDDDDTTPDESSANKNKPEVNDAEEEEEDDNDEDDILGEAEETNQKDKPTKVSIKKPASSDDKENEDDEEEEEEDILDVLADDDEEEDSDDDDDDDDDDNEPNDEKNKKKPLKISTTTTAKPATIKIKRPTTQQTVQTRKPITTTERAPASSTLQEKVTAGKPTEKIFTYQEPVEAVTQKVIIYQEPQNDFPNKIFIYKDPENKIVEKTTQKVVFYEDPVQQTVPEKFIIYQEPEEKPTEEPAIAVKDSNNSSDEDDSDEEDKAENDDENSSEEEFDDNTDSEKHTLVASIVKPEFSNKYAEAHDLTEADDLDIEDSEDDENDFNEDRKLKQNQKKPVTKPPPIKKSQVTATKPKVFSLSSLIAQQKKYHDTPKDDRIISTSRTHRRMNLDRLLQV